MSYEQEKANIDNLLNQTNDFEERMNLMGKIHELKLKYGISRISGGELFECVGCGS